MGGMGDMDMGDMGDMGDDNDSDESDDDGKFPFYLSNAECFLLLCLRSGNWIWRGWVI